ncbi:MAG: IS5 family transposase, partial [Candidatus Micrarchaeaceae archaeon]
RGKGTKIMAIADRSGLPIAVHIENASPHETKLVKATIAQRFVRDRPSVLIGDKAYDSDTLDKALSPKGIRLIAPHGSNGRKLKSQDGRELRRYRRRWKIERLFAWFHNFRRIVTRWEFLAENFKAFVHLACIVILLRNYL